MQRWRRSGTAADRPSKFGVALKDSVKLSGKTDFSGYDRLQGAGRITALIFDGAVVNTLGVGQEGQVVLDETPFYAEGGGQMGDSGTLSSPGARFTVRDTQKIGASFAHIGVVESGMLRVGDELRSARRRRAANRHRPQSFRDAPLARRLARRARQARAAERIAGRTGSLALRFFAYSGRSGRRSAQDRGDGEQGHSPQRPGANAGNGAR